MIDDAFYQYTEYNYVQGTGHYLCGEGWENEVCKGCCRLSITIILNKGVTWYFYVIEGDLVEILVNCYNIFSLSPCSLQGH